MICKLIFIVRLTFPQPKFCSYHSFKHYLIQHNQTKAWLYLTWFPSNPTSANYYWKSVASNSPESLLISVLSCLCKCLNGWLIDLNLFLMSVFVFMITVECHLSMYWLISLTVTLVTKIDSTCLGKGSAVFIFHISIAFESSEILGRRFFLLEKFWAFYLSSFKASFFLNIEL